MVGTPIGNLEDLTPRAARVLGSVAAVAAEDTRRTRGLLAHLGIHARLIAVPAEAERERSEPVLRLLRRGEDVAFVTDAGMPAVSDPGQYLIARCLQEGIPVTVVPGPSAVVAALVASGLPVDRWAFEGFLPRRGRARKERLEAVAADERATVLFESPRRAAETLGALAEACGADRPAAVARELTKLHEEVNRGTLAALASDYAAREEVRGEIAIVVGGAPPARRRPSRTAGWPTRRQPSSRRACAPARPRPRWRAATASPRTPSTRPSCSAVAAFVPEPPGTIPLHGPVRRRVLHHDADLLPERRAAHRACLHLGGHGLRLAVAPAAR